MKRRKLTPTYAEGAPCPQCPGSRLQKRPAAFANFKVESDVAWCAHCRCAWALKNDPAVAKVRA